jgi:hypothetical protein
MQVELRNFWAENSIGHKDSEGNDPTRNFLKSLFSDRQSIDFERCVITSHFKSQSRLDGVIAAFKKYERRISANSLEKRQILHGHSSDGYQLDPRAINVWYTTENIRPPLYEAFKLFLSHDLDPYDGRNAYLPFWVTRLGNNVAEAANNQEQLLNSREIPPRSGICAIISNPEPIRMAFIQQLSLRHKVDVYGAFGLPIVDKREILSKYRVNVCFENSEAPGYVTEKPLEAWQAGCVPVWRGIDNAKHLNPQALIDVSKLGFAESINEITKIMNSDVYLRSFTSQPLIDKRFDFDSLQNQISSNFS